MPTKYNHTNLSQFRSSLKQASGDLLGVFWTDAEWNSIVQEAILTFGALSGFWKDDIEILTSNNKRVYDIFIDSNVGSTAPSLTYGDIVEQLNRDLIEELSTINPISQLFNLTEILSLIESAYNSYQSLTNLIITSYELNVAAQNNIVKISDDTINLIRVVYELDGIESILEFVDEQEIGYFSEEDLTEEGTPLYYSTIYGSPNEIKLYPIPANSSKLKILSVNGRNTTNPLTVNTVINLPNNLVPYLKYNILHSIYSKDGIINDPYKAAYCDKRWKEGITIGKNYPSILIAKSNGLMIQTDSLNKLDSYITPESTDERPNILGLAGYNIFEVDTIPNATVNSILLTVTQNATLPIDDGDFIDIALEYMAPLVDYCLHLAQIKCGIADMSATNSYYENFIRIAIGHNKKLQNRGISFENLVGRSKREEIEKPKLATLVEEAA